MYKMIIADDEPSVRQYIRYIVKRHNLPFEICGEAADGQEAVQLADLYQPEFVFLDISMPRMSGLDAAEIIRKKYPQTVIYILTAYSQFDYAHKAIRTQVADYLLKPIRPALVVDTLKQGINHVLQQRLEKQRTERMTTQIKKTKPLIIKQRMFELLKGDGNNEDMLLRRLTKTENFRPAAVMAAAVWGDIDTPERANLAERLVWEFSSRFSGRMVTASMGGETAGILRELSHNLCCELKLLIDDWQQRYHVSLSAGVSPVSNNRQISAAYRDADEIRRTAVFWRKKGLFFAGDVVKNSQAILCGNAIFKQIRNFLMERQSAKAKLIVTQFFSDIGQQMYSATDVYGTVDEIINHLINEYAEHIISAEDAVLLRKTFAAKLDAVQSGCDLERCLCSLIDKLAGIISLNEQNQAEQSVKWAVEYINQNYNQNLTLDNIAEKLFLSSGYFCRIFKKFTGEGFAAYITKVRLNKAKDLLLSGKYTVAEAARLVGFNDSSYFSCVFKRHFNMAPSKLIETRETGQ